MFKSVWYYNLTKPPLAPPDWIFPPVWSILYFSMLVALLLYLFKPAQNKKSGYIYFAVQSVFLILFHGVTPLCTHILTLFHSKSSVSE